ncbi:hypothetical protein BDN71DRAFT_1437139 [Pleurotus eryngii]|uniref:Uncharacterized protein n=1 Tax=Pleurotus eryngii TaxID=5323 RepID=A0A9P5ZI47_PLEER|nr:hypothetical protein BDN71DRAFT_1437139 [Pleurotus eryngii]
MLPTLVFATECRICFLHIYLVVGTTWHFGLNFDLTSYIPLEKEYYSKCGDYRKLQASSLWPSGSVLFGIMPLAILPRVLLSLASQFGLLKAMPLIEGFTTWAKEYNIGICLICDWVNKCMSRNADIGEDTEINDQILCCMISRMSSEFGVRMLAKAC